MSKVSSSVIDVFLECHSAIRRGELVRRQSRRDKEFHFQDWFSSRLGALNIHFDVSGRNKYPDFTLVHSPVGFEIKGLKFPGRVATYDCNSQIPRGEHNGREIIYVFGRYPADPLHENEYPVYDLLLCHGDFLNADHEYAHENKSVRGFGSYGDIMIRDRKMYVAPTPFALMRNTEGQITLVLPFDYPDDGRVVQVGELVRVESEQLVVGYHFDLQKNKLSARFIPNPRAGIEHKFVAYRSATDPGPRVMMAE
jgi:hypothetical protein